MTNTARFKNKKKVLIEQHKKKKADRLIITDENESLGPTNHLSRAAKSKFIAAATTLDPHFLESARSLSQKQFIFKTLHLSLQDNGNLYIESALVGESLGYHSFQIQTHPPTLGCFEKSKSA